MRSKKKVDVKRLAAALTDYPFAYLITVDDGYRVHTVTVAPELRSLPESPDGPAAVLDIGLVGGHTRENLAHRSDVTLLWPPSEPGGYSLIVDGIAEAQSGSDAGSEAGSETVRLGVVPTRALLHREADPDSPTAAKGCKHDCVVFALPA
ncbi:MAG TPA: pyridoxamine 5'-phosphate oxidase family protein [Mycobacterium sp.]|nr:pyridoxamine 5'-phosphate oxidase family protein [Mycobacterium sp.]